MIDTVTGEIIEDSQYYDIESVEQELLQSIGQEVDQKLRQTKLLLIIRDRELYRQKLNVDGEYYRSFQLYLKDLARELNTIGIGKARSLSNWITKYRIFVNELGKAETVLRELGAHGELLLPAASRYDPTGELLEEDQVTPSGRRLGRQKFSELVDEIEERVVASKSGIPEEHWGIEDTKARVAEAMQKTQEDKLRFSFDAVWSGNDVKIKRMQAWIGDFVYDLPSIMPIGHFRLLARNAQVEGLGEDWR